MDEVGADDHPGEGDPEGDGSQRADDPDEDADGSELIETPADEGLGGWRVEDLPEQGTEEDVKAALEQAHGRSEHPEEDAVDQYAIATAIIQGVYFETPSAAIIGVEEYQPNVGPAWASRMKPLARIRTGADCDTDIAESVLGPALLKTRRIFSDNKTSAYQPNLRSGRVNQKVLGKRAWSGDDRLFGKKRLPAKKDYAVQIMADISTSNNGDNFVRLKRSIIAQAELMNRVGIEFSIVCHSATLEDIFDETGFVLQLHHIKDWNEPWNPTVRARLEKMNTVGGNLDGRAMEFGRKSLETRTATDKILLYYTDGRMPAANHDEELPVMEEQIKRCKRTGITLLGVGMNTDSPVRHGLDTVMVQGDDDIKDVVEHLGKRLQKTAR